MSTPTIFFLLAAAFGVWGLLCFRSGHIEGAVALTEAVRDRATAREFAEFRAILSRQGPCDGDCKCGDCGPFPASVKDLTPVGEMPR